MFAGTGAEVYVRIHANGANRPLLPVHLPFPPPLPILMYPSSMMIPTAFPSAFLDAYCDATGFENRGVTYADNMVGINWSTIPVTIVEMDL